MTQPRTLATKPAQKRLIVSSTNLLMPAAGQNGSGGLGVLVNGTAFNGSSGIFTNDTVAFDEYGIITIQVAIEDGDYLAAGNVQSAVSGNVGRFTVGQHVVASSSVAASCGAMTYLDQSFPISVRVEAQGSGGNTLHNYHSAWLTPDIATPTFDAESVNDGNNHGPRMSIPATTWNNGVWELIAATSSFTSDAAPDGPFPATQLGVRIDDPVDGLDIDSANMNATAATDCIALADCTARGIGSTVNYRFGRLEVLNEFGPETQAIAVGLQASTWNGTALAVDADDDCSQYQAGGTTLGNYTGGLPAQTVTGPVGPTSLTDGRSLSNNGLVLSIPGAGNTGTVDLTLDVPAWLEYPWAGGADYRPDGYRDVWPVSRPRPGGVLARAQQLSRRLAGTRTC